MIFSSVLSVVLWLLLSGFQFVSVLGAFFFPRDVEEFFFPASQ